MLNYKKKFFFKKKVLITGHTGFKGSWLSLWMHLMGAKVLGISKDIPTIPSHFKLAKLNKLVKSNFIDIENLEKIKKIIKDFKPDYIFHLAAQAIVKKSYSNSITTWKSNLIGTINILESLKEIKKKTIVVLITSDKVYKNIETKKGYKENDTLGGVDPYGASKSATEIAINSYIKSFFSSKKNKIFISTARAGNVIGGGDWSENRLIPDSIRALTSKKKMSVRNPNSTRPWQHVLEVLNGYINLAMNLKKNKKLHGHAFNFGPGKKNYKVIEVLRKMNFFWKKINWNLKKNKNFFENTLLNLDTKKSNKILKWKCKLSFSISIKMTVDWYRNYFMNRNRKSKILKKSVEQIKNFEVLK
jgi:CDP-glucose 4,6-dehydratase